MPFKIGLKSIYNFFLPEKTHPVQARRALLMVGLSSFGILFLIIFGTLGIIQGNPVLGIFDFSTASVLALNLWHARKKSNIKINILIGIFLVSLLYVYLYVSGGVNQTAGLWYFTYPLIVNYLVGSRLGLISSVLMLIPVFLLAIIQPESDFFAQYDKYFLIRFICSYFVVSLFSYLFERTRETNQKELNAINRSLEDIVIQRTQELKDANEKLLEDIARRKEIEKNLETEEQKLYVNEERLRLVMQATQQSWFDLNLKTLEVVTSPEFASIVGAETEESPVSYQGWIDSIHNNDRDAVLECFSDCLKTGEAIQMEYRMITRSGEWKWIHSSAKVVAFDEANLPVRMTGTHMDITERKIAEENLQKSESRLKEAQKIVKLGYFEYDFQKGNIWWSDQTYKILGIKTADIPPNYETFIKRLSENDKDKLKTLVGRAEKYGEDYSISCSYQIPDGALKYLDLQAQVVFNESGKPKGLKGTILDVTEKKKIQNQLNQSQKMQAIGTLAGGVAHDFNNILSAIFGYTQLAQNSLDSKKKLEEYLKEVMKGAERASDIVQQILTFSRKTDYKKIPLNICSEVQQAVKLIRASIPSTIEFSLNYNSKKSVNADPTKIHQVVMNLCTNGYHSMKDKNGILKISVVDKTVAEPRIFLNKTLEPGMYVCLEVNDTGCGMDEKTILKVTEPYFTTKKKGQGTGMGLALVEAIVEEHDGFLEIQSEVGKGSCFSIYLPPALQKNDVSESNSEETEDNLKGNETIMVVDDEEAIRSIIKANLQEYGYHPVMFQNGLEALEAFESEPDRFDLVITDQAMPKLSGVELTKKLIKRKPDLPVIMITGYSENISKEAAEELGLKNLLKKPFKSKSVILEIRDILDKI